MKILLTILLSLFLVGGFSQSLPNWQPVQNAPMNYYLWYGQKDSVYMFSPKDTFNARYPSMVMRSDGTMWKTLGGSASWTSLGGGGANDSSSNFYLKDTLYAHYDTLFWMKGTNTYYTRIDTFSANPTLYGASFGKYVAGNTPIWKGLTAREAILDAITQCNHPNYVSPNATISASPSFGQYEYGTNLGTITLSSGFSQNNGGTLSSTTYTANGTPLGGNTFTISSLTTTNTAFVNKAYGQGACINNNCGQLDCTGRINAGSVNSGTSNYTTGYRRYYGWILDTTGITTGGQDLAIRSVIDITQFNTSAVFGSSISPISTGNPPSGSAYYIFGYVSSSPTMSDIVINGTPLGINAFNVNVRSNFTNSQGATVSIRIYYNKNKQFGSFSVYTTSN